MNDLISRQAAIDALERQKDKTAKGEIGSFYNTIIQHDIDVIVELPSAQPEKTECIPDTKTVQSQRDCVDLAERVTATFYNEEYEEWTQQTVTIADVLDSVCDEYTILPFPGPYKGGDAE